MRNRNETAKRDFWGDNSDRVIRWVIFALALAVGALAVIYTMFRGIPEKGELVDTILLPLVTGLLSALTAFIGGMAFFIQHRMTKLQDQLDEGIRRISVSMADIKQAGQEIGGCLTEMQGFGKRIEKDMYTHQQNIESASKTYLSRSLSLLRQTQNLVEYKMEFLEQLSPKELDRHLEVTNNLLSEWQKRVLESPDESHKAFWSSIYLSYMEEERKDLAEGFLVTNIGLYTALIGEIGKHLRDSIPEHTRAKLTFVTPVCARHFFNWPHQVGICSKADRNWETKTFYYREKFLDSYRNVLESLSSKPGESVCRYLLVLREGLTQERIWEDNPALAGWHLETKDTLEKNLRLFVRTEPQSIRAILNAGIFEESTGISEEEYDNTGYLKMLRPQILAYPISERRETLNTFAGGEVMTVGEYYISRVHSSKEHGFVKLVGFDEASTIADLNVPIEFVLFGYQEEDRKPVYIGGLTATIHAPFVTSEIQIIPHNELASYENMIQFCAEEAIKVCDILERQ